MLKLFRLHILFLFVVTALVTGCSENEMEPVDGDHHIPLEVDEAISDYIIEKYSSINHGTEKQFEVHKIYGTSESNGILSVYMWSYYGGFNKSTGLENQAGHSLPAVIRLKKEVDHYVVKEYTETQDGELYSSSLKKMFPERYLKLVGQDTGNIEDLQKEMDQKVSKWLES
ncbi:hypothetical protein [Sporosarcina obsidiansis]|uniref:hypothetical protein n=1 Tax=Sporosarcina obsidiansis TaxID=2660748 RepID=UPI00129A4D49|nr:hypothetical protein [Sporosarcina obsidiansis]